MTAPRTAIAAILIMVTAASVELVMGRVPICTCGTIDLWVGARDSDKTSQMLTDWYSFSHAIHGFLFYLGLWLVGRRWPIGWRFLGALGIEAAWETFENTPFVIDRYRATAAARGYSGDTVLNSLADVLLMCIGFLAARKLPVWFSVALVIIMELIPLYVIRDNLTLNIWTFIAPNNAIQAWQARG